MLCCVLKEWDDLNEEHYDWPTTAEVRRYRDRVRGVVHDVIQKLDLSKPVKFGEPLWYRPLASLLCSALPSSSSHVALCLCVVVSAGVCGWVWITSAFTSKRLRSSSAN